MQLTVSKSRENAGSPAWSPDGKQLAFVALRDGYFGLYRKASDGQGAGGAALQELGTDDAHRLVAGRSVPHVFLDRPDGWWPLCAPARWRRRAKAIEVFRNKSQNQGPRLSPDSGVMTYTSNVSGRFEVYAIPFDPAATAGTAPAAGPWQMSDQGGTGMVFWGRDGKELYYLAADRAIMAVDVTAGATPQFGKPRVLFRPPPEIARALLQARRASAVMASASSSPFHGRSSVSSRSTIARGRWSARSESLASTTSPTSLPTAPARS